MTNLTDTQLEVLFQGGKEKVFEDIVLHYQSHIYSYVLIIVKDADAANDIFQDIFVRVFEKLCDYREEHKFKNWIFTISKHAIMDYFKKSKRKFVSFKGRGNDGGDRVSHTKASADKAPQTLDKMRKIDERDRIRGAIDKLSQDERELIYLKNYFTFKEIAEMQNKPIEAELSKFNRALKKLRKILNDMEYGGEG